MATDLDPIKSAQSLVGIAGDIAKIAGENPDVRAAGKEVGKSLLTVAKAVNVCLLPLAAVNFGIEKARVYFNGGQFEADMNEATKAIPGEALAEPPSMIAGPALQGLAFTHEEPSLRAMFLALIASAMDTRNASDVHPSFTEIIRQLSPLEAVLLAQPLVHLAGGVPIARYSVSVGSGMGASEVPHQVHVMPYHQEGVPVLVPNEQLMVENWMRLGLVTVDYGICFSNEQMYEYARKRPEYLKLIESNDSNVVGVHKGVMKATAYGRRFASVVGMEKTPREPVIDLAK